jgi:hypothetical protein
LRRVQRSAVFEGGREDIESYHLSQESVKKKKIEVGSRRVNEK